MKLIVDSCRNHLGNSEIISQMIDIAAKKGASYIKFQIFDPTLLNPTWPNYEQAVVEYKNHALTDNQILDILELCRGRIIPMFTIFSPNKLDFLRDATINETVAFKIASPDLLNNIIWSKLLDKFPSEIFASTGMNTREQIDIIRNVYGTDKRVKFLYCVSRYPTQRKDIDFEYMKTFDGFSDHTLGVDITLDIVKMNCIEYIEKHFTLSRNLPGKDQQISIEPQELFDIVFEMDYIKSCERYKRRWLMPKDS